MPKVPFTFELDYEHCGYSLEASPGEVPDVGAWKCFSKKRNADTDKSV